MVDQMRIATKNQRPACTQDQTGVGAIIVAEKKDCVGCPRTEPGGQRGIVEAAEMIRAGTRSAVRDELMGIARKEVAVPGEGGAELWIALRSDPEIPEIENPEIKWGGRREPCEPRTIILGGVREDNREARARGGAGRVGRWWLGAHHSPRKFRMRNGMPRTTTHA